tara:strand:- start:15193 stop:15462 length:270 start_codon:yes stop_codon:yes gene_type:complete
MQVDLHEVAKDETWDLLKYFLSGAITMLAFIMVYFFNQIQSLGIRISDNEKAIALNDAHDKTTDGVLSELKEMIKKLDGKIDQLLLNKK